MNEKKICRVCNKWKSIEDFYPNKQKGTIRTQCKSCAKQANTIRLIKRNLECALNSIAIEFNKLISMQFKKEK